MNFWFILTPRKKKCSQILLVGIYYYCFGLRIDYCREGVLNFKAPNIFLSIYCQKSMERVFFKFIFLQLTLTIFEWTVTINTYFYCVFFVFPWCFLSLALNFNIRIELLVCELKSNFYPNTFSQNKKKLNIR